MPGLVFAAAAVLALSATSAHAQPEPLPRPKIGLALGGGSARGIAHIGVLRWFEEHRIPVDVVAGTSMGGLVGGAFASGMPPSELSSLLLDTDWDKMFGASNFAFKNVRRKQDARAYPSRLELGLKKGLHPPVSLNDGQQVDLFLARIAAPYYALGSFDELPTPFRCVAVDLRTAKAVVLDGGSLAQAMRATMSLPGIFPPVEMGDRVLVDGGALNNIPADVVRAMGADVVIAVNVGTLDDLEAISYSLFGLASQTLDAMMRATTREALASADLVIDVPVVPYGSLAWRRSAELIEEGYRAAEAMSDRLLPHAVDDAAWEDWLAARRAARRTSLPVPGSVSVEGVGRSDRRVMEATLARHTGRQLDLSALEKDLASLTGLDRYQTITWSMVGEGDGATLAVRARDKPYAPPFFMMGVGLENLSSDEFRFQLAGRILAFDVLGSGSELRLDGAVGADPSAGVALHRPLGSSPLFLAPYGIAARRGFAVIADDAVIAEYRQTRWTAGLDLGVNLGRQTEVRVGASIGHLDTEVQVGDPGLPDLGGTESRARLRFLHDGHDNLVVPSRGQRVEASIEHVFDSPETPGFTRTNDDLTQAEVEASSFFSFRRRNRLFVLAGAGTSFETDPLPTEQFVLGRPFRLSAFSHGEVRGNDYLLLTTGYLREVARLPDFLGGPVFLGGWLENGSAFDDLSSARLSTHVGAGAFLETLLGPVMIAVGVGLDGEWRYYLAIGRIFH
jgi:NTE family protein